ncbi:MAG: type IV pilus assembly protein PilM [Candidatus Pacebacteria bacterium]|jgi:type IV pilus assembly protein PilM|nr:type IV pilus assembly protein PilM [Candidatus Paceibacterota bacterium]MBT3511926.1 type IV pilus assembly protein PilM [Candidatus Paceibacterota bacterium]MBT4005248.1 type IV pilus assembly protein PilM [Candidatus Paceibacterota bacterium]MBT4358968.1 type IV pilus assembly protein PilM [Candidatus Paceibacterota bacterium]MBT4680467.1 type IV pilus assembly protein PilM [Candidatus Paceibacterota bacterium]
MSALSLDIGTYAIKAISGNPGKKIEVERFVEVFNPLGVSIPSDEALMQKFVDLIESIIADNKLPRNDVRLSLPESVVSTNIIELPTLSDAELASAIGWQAEQHIPIPPDQLSLQYQVLHRPSKENKNDEKMRVLLVGVHKDLVERYTNVFLTLGIEPKLLETQMLSVLRALDIEKQEPPTLVLQMGASNTQLAMVYEGELRFITSQMTGGHALTQSLERQINLSAQQAEEYKRAYGLDENQFEGKVKAALLPVVQIMVNEIRKAMTFFVNQYPGVNAQRILLSGGPTLLPGLVQYITQEVGVEVLVAAPFSNVTGMIPEANHPTWTVCMGLMAREEL